MDNITRDYARKVFKGSGILYSDLTVNNLQRLRNLIDKKMIEGKYMESSFRCKQRFSIIRKEKYGEIEFADLKCKSFYFGGREARQAVTFEEDDFIGFAGWADGTNIIPILEGFIKWVNEMKKEKIKWKIT